MKIDPQFTKEIQDWLNDEKHETVTGADLLIRVNPRNVSYRRWHSLAIMRPKTILPKIERELKIHLKYRLDGLTLQEVNRLDREIVPQVEKVLAEGIPAQPTDVLVSDENGTPVIPASVILNPEDETDAQVIVKQLGRRADHEQLPDDIKALWDQNGTIYKDMKAVFEELKSMENLPSCQRYDKLQLLDAMDKRYMAQMQQYDEYVINGQENTKTVDNSSDDTSVEAKDVTTARSYISKNKDKLASLQQASLAEGATEKDKSAFNNLLAKMQQRVDVLVTANAAITDDMRQSLEAVGLNFYSHENEHDTEETPSAE
ncbi:hypothetical protein SAMN05216455_10215 [Segatella bryantii]|uniref:hypothetical protein n=1 Tax=Segatella bryantii TaxID=77095 RepID=UPI00089B51D1|nr:hypothetical protein [Segatella bryantii]SDZ94416.1 hypothetical protein SAMN05216455_10215 [Segatella bryantii]